MKYKSLFFISPPFYSHFNPLLNLAKSFRKLGAKVYLGCSIEFKEQVLEAGINFYELDISKNKNIQKAESTDQPDSEKERLEEFFQATRQGAVQTLITQSRHRKDDMLYDPHTLIGDLEKINEHLEIDLYVVDVLSYSVTLALYSLNLKFMTFCPPHPYTIPDKDMNYGVPKFWPQAIAVSEEELAPLIVESKSTQKEFTDVFNSIIGEKNLAEPIDNAFSLVSDTAIVYNYFDFKKQEKSDQQPMKIYAGHSFEPKKLDEKWLTKVQGKEKKILITLGTFLSNRKDVLEKLIAYTRNYYPEALLIVSAGANAKKMSPLSSDKTIIAEFIPQIALMPWMDLVIFHGGCNTLTEAMYYGKNMIVLPFSSDQFNIAYDMEEEKLAAVLDPNHFKEADLIQAFEEQKTHSKERLLYFSEISQQRGSDFVAKKILGIE